jgi:hypothetical protein
VNFLFPKSYHRYSYPYDYRSPALSSRSSTTSTSCSPIFVLRTFSLPMRTVELGTIWSTNLVSFPIAPCAPYPDSCSFTVSTLYKLSIVYNVLPLVIHGVPCPSTVPTSLVQSLTPDTDLEASIVTIHTLKLGGVVIGHYERIA